MSIIEPSIAEPRDIREREVSVEEASGAPDGLVTSAASERRWFERRRTERRSRPSWLAQAQQRWAAWNATPASRSLPASELEEGEERQEETREAELIVAIFRTLVLLIALLGPRVLHFSATDEVESRIIWLAAVAGVYNILTALGCLFPSRYGLRRPFVVTMDLLLITLWIQLSGQWELRPFYYIVVVVAAMWYRVLGGLLAATFCNFFFLFIWSRAWDHPHLLNPPGFSATMAINTAMMFFVGCLVGYIAEAQERDRERRLEDQLLIANYQREIDLSSQLQPSLMPSLWLNNETGTAPAQPESSLEVGAAMKTARTLGGGDYFDLIPLSEGRIGLCIADVSGKSVRAQARLPLLKYSLRALAPLYLQPDKLVERLNETLAPDLQPELYIALCYIVLDPRKETLSWCNAGHIAPLLLNPQSTKTKTGDRSTLLMMKPVDKAVETAAASGDNEPDANAMVPEPLETDGPAIGMFPDMVYEAHSRPWQPGSQLLLYTDGLTDAFSFRGSEDGESQVSKLAARLQRETHREPRELAQELVDLADAVLDDATPLERAHTVLSQSAFKYDHELAGDPDTKHRDDITVVIVRYKTTVDSETT